MTAPSSRDRMQLLAYTDTDQLLYDGQDTQQFWLYSKTDNSITQMTSNDARTWYKTVATHMIPGLNFWNFAGKPAPSQRQSNAG